MNKQFAEGFAFYPATEKALQYGIFGNLVISADKVSEPIGKVKLNNGEKYYITQEPKPTKVTFKESGHEKFPDGLRIFVKEDFGAITAEIIYDLDVLLNWAAGKELRFSLRKSRNEKFYLMINDYQKKESTPF